MSYNGNFSTPTRLPTKADTSVKAYNAGYNVGQQAYKSDQMDFDTSKSLYSNSNTSNYSQDYLRGLRQGSTGRGGKSSRRKSRKTRKTKRRKSYRRRY
jgi:hypothetical protein